METVDDIVGYQDPLNDLDKLCYFVIGAAIAVHNELGPGYAESVYENAKCLELAARGIAHDRQHEFMVFYREQPVGKGRIDILVENILIVEIKSAESIASIFIAQTISYPRAKQLPLALLLNFNVRRLSDGVRRIANTRAK